MKIINVPALTWAISNSQHDGFRKKLFVPLPVTAPPPIVLPPTSQAPAIPLSLSFTDFLSLVLNRLIMVCLIKVDNYCYLMYFNSWIELT